MDTDIKKINITKNKLLKFLRENPTCLKAFVKFNTKTKTKTKGGGIGDRKRTRDDYSNSSNRSPQQKKLRAEYDDDYTIQLIDKIFSFLHNRYPSNIKNLKKETLKNTSQIHTDYKCGNNNNISNSLYDEILRFVMKLYNENFIKRSVSVFKIEIDDYSQSIYFHYTARNHTTGNYEVEKRKNIEDIFKDDTQYINSMTDDVDYSRRMNILNDNNGLQSWLDEINDHKILRLKNEFLYLNFYEKFLRKITIRGLKRYSNLTVLLSNENFKVYFYISNYTINFYIAVDILNFPNDIIELSIPLDYIDNYRTREDRANNQKLPAIYIKHFYENELNHDKTEIKNLENILLNKQKRQQQSQPQLQTQPQSTRANKPRPNNIHLTLIECENGFHYTDPTISKHYYFNNVKNIFDMYLVSKYFDCRENHPFNPDLSKFLLYIAKKWIGTINISELEINPEELDNVHKKVPSDCISMKS